MSNEKEDFLDLIQKESTEQSVPKNKTIMDAVFTQRKPVEAAKTLPETQKPSIRPSKPIPKEFQEFKKTLKLMLEEVLKES
jgi:hypothetical protein